MECQKKCRMELLEKLLFVGANFCLSSRVLFILQNIWYEIGFAGLTVTFDLVQFCSRGQCLNTFGEKGCVPLITVSRQLNYKVD